MTAFRYFHRGCLLFGCIILTIGRSGAQDSLSIDQCVALALANSPRLHQARNDIQLGEATLSELRTSALPQISAIGGGTYAPVPPPYGYDPAITDGGQLMGQIVLRQSVFDGGIRSLKYDQARLDITRARFQEDRTRADLVLEVKQAFAEVLRAAEEVRLRKASDDQLTSYLQLVEQLYRGGTASYNDLLKVQVDHAAALVALDRAREASAAARISLGAVMGADVDSTVQFSGSLPEGEKMPAESDSASGTIDIEIAQLLHEKGRLEVDLVSHEQYPVLSFFADAGYLSSGDNLRLSGDARLNTVGFSLGMNIEIPIFNWGATGLRMEERRLEADDLGEEVTAVRRSVSSETRQIRMHLERSRARLTILVDAIRKGEQSFLLTSAAYASGAVRAIDVLSAHQSLTDAKIAELQERADIALLSARLERISVHGSSVHQ